MIHANPNKPVALFALILIQAICVTFFLWDVLEDARPEGIGALANLHIAIEAMAALCLIAAVMFETRYLMTLLRRKSHLERQVSVAAGAFHDIIQGHFDRWKLTPAEQDVANFTIKGLSIPEIAALRGSAEGTVKSHLNGIYRKAGVTGRGALVGLLIEDLFETPLVKDNVLEVKQQA
ncbi:Bacterial regulatory proteins, luxR family [Roseovarius litorisediminis]|uniref:Bacterial regulatory proteins, luxR family n=1 Tax=Roseovarius litorisediminis TaxID=1312363 RepID=A0A1Y5R5S8_9RHOB|nr:LuxR C-terminal-related transcriptional regulator [Roseovarius litorisediminis]SLN09896.1 Bacterial regulatory proteins, luxR family [Roseovarius litorisediminis]